MEQRVVRNQDGTYTNQTLCSYKSLGFGKDETGSNPVTFNPATNTSPTTASFPARQSTPIILGKLMFDPSTMNPTIGGTIRYTVSGYDGGGSNVYVAFTLTPCRTTLQSDGMTYNSITSSDMTLTASRLQLECPTVTNANGTITCTLKFNALVDKTILNCPLGIGFYSLVTLGANTLVTINDFTIHTGGK